MDVGAASALTLSNYQMALNSYGQGVISSLANAIGTSSATSGPKNTAVLQDISNIYSSLTGDANGGLSAADSLSSSADTNVLSPPESGPDSSSVTSGSAAFTASLATSSAMFGGLDSTSASILFGGTGVSGSDGLSSSAINLNASVALASYTAHQNGIPSGTIGAAASAAAAKIDTTQPATIQNAIQSAQSSLLTNTLNIFG